MKLGITTLAIACIEVACSHAPCPANEPRVSGACPQIVDAGPDAQLPATCIGACTNMRRLGCELGRPTPKGAACEQVCENVQRENAGAGFNMSCVARASTCAEADSCR